MPNALITNDHRMTISNEPMPKNKLFQSFPKSSFIHSSFPVGHFFVIRHWKVGITDSFRTHPPHPGVTVFQCSHARKATRISQAFHVFHSESRPEDRRESRSGAPPPCGPIRQRWGWGRCWQRRPGLIAPVHAHRIHTVPGHQVSISSRLAVGNRAVFLLLAGANRSTKSVRAVEDEPLPERPHAPAPCGRGCWKPAALPPTREEGSLGRCRFRGRGW